MRILYIGKSDLLAAETVNSFRKEGNDVYLLSEEEFPPGVKPALKYKMFTVSGNYADTEKYFVNISPETVIFAGNQYREEEWRAEERTNLMILQLLNVLNYSSAAETDKFIFLSSSHVLDGRTAAKAEEDSIRPSDYRGLVYAQAEEMVRLWGKSSGMDFVILRTDLILADRMEEGAKTLVNRMALELLSEGSCTADRNRIYSPVFIRDLANAIYRCSGVTMSDCYHVAGNEEISEAELACKVKLVLGGHGLVEETEGENVSWSLSNERIKKELEWVPFYSVEKTFVCGKIKPDKKRRIKRKRKRRENTFVATVENLSLFGLMAALGVWGGGNPVLYSVDLMLLYVLMAGLVFGMKQSVPSILYSCCFYILNGYGEQFSFIGMLTNVETLIRFTVYIFVGVAAGYTVDYYRIKMKERDTEYRFLKKEYETIQEINNDNFAIKQEYQKRLLNYKTSLPKLYSVISRLTVLEPERIFTETIRAVKDIMEVETVAVYLAREGSSYMRLMVSSDDRAVLEGKSWNLNDYPDIRGAFAKDEVFIGSVRRSREPALAAPIYYQGRCIAALVIKEVPFTRLSLNYTNLFRTLTVMITSSIVKAKDYENTVKRNLYLPETEILYPSEFGKMLEIARDKKEQSIADYCIIRMTDELPAEEIYMKSANVLRNTDFFGIDDGGSLYVLLGNTSIKEADFVLERMKKAGCPAQVVPYEELVGLSLTKHAGERREQPGEGRGALWE